MTAPSFPQTATQTIIALSGTQNILITTLDKPIDLASLYALMGNLLQQVGHPANAECTFGFDPLTSSPTITVTWTTIP